MADLNSLLIENLALAFGVLAALVIALLVVVILQQRRLSRAIRSYREIVRDDAGGSLHDRLAGSAEQSVRASERMGEMERLYSGIDQRSRQSLQHIGLVRFNPFEDTGSDQSFAIALLDDERNGIVISSLHGRANTRLFAKPVNDGSSTHTLSDEEGEAIRLALGPAPRA